MRLHAPYVSEKKLRHRRLLEGSRPAEYVQGFLDRQGRAVSPDGSTPTPTRTTPCSTMRAPGLRIRQSQHIALAAPSRVGYGRAAHLIDLMERDGLVGAADGSRPRELLKAPGWLHEVAATANE